MTGSGDILLEARGSAGDVDIQGAILSGGGNITVNASDDIRSNASIGTTAVAPQSGTIYLAAANASLDAAVGAIDGIDLGGQVISQLGDIVLDSTLDIRQTGTITSTSGDVAIVADRDYLQFANVSTQGNQLVDAARDWTQSAASQSTAGSRLLGTVGRDINLGLVSAQNVSLSATRNIADANGLGATNIIR